MPNLSHKQQNGSGNIYSMDPFCLLMKGILILVRLVNYRWNQFYPSLILMYEKLDRLSKYN